MSENTKSQAVVLFEKMDEKQIERADKAVKQAMVYTTKIGGNDVKEITYVGVKHLVLELSTRGHSLEILESKCDLEKDDPTDKTTWKWRAYKKFKNTNTGLETDGRSECPYLDAGKYDAFGQRKADSKAERNALRKQIPELVIKEFLKSVGADKTQEVKPEQELCRCQPIVCKNNPPVDGKCPQCKKARAE